MKKYKSNAQRLVALAVVFSLFTAVDTARATIIYDNNAGPNQNYTAGATVDASYTPTSGANSVLVLGVSHDGILSGLSASFGGSAMTLAGSNNRTAIFYLLNPGNSAGALTLTLGDNGQTPETISYGTLSNVNTSIAPVISTGVVQSGPTLTGSTLNGLMDTDYVFGAFYANNAASYNGFSGQNFSTGLVELQAFNSGGTVNYNGAIAGGIVGLNGDYAPTLNFTGGTSSGTPNPVGGVFIAFAQFTPEPSTAVLALLGLVGFVARRPRRRS